MWYVLTHALSVCFGITAGVKFTAVWGKNVFWGLWRGELPDILDFSPVKFFIFAVVCTKLMHLTWPTLLLVASAYFYYSMWLIISIRFLRSGYSWPRTAWMIASRPSGPYIGWSS